MNDYPNIQAGAFALLFDACSILNSLNVEYIIVGGWSPYLLNSTEIKHPGTKDVDILFDKAYVKHTLKDVLSKFLDNGYVLSAKHDFQLFKKISVLKKDFIYNVDLLHPLETETPKDIYVEQIDLDIPADIYQHETFKMKSIALPSSQALFYNKAIIDYKLADSVNNEEVTIPLMSELGTLITKSKSVSVGKRYRDSLDIFLAIKQSSNYQKLIADILQLKNDSLLTFNTLYGIRKVYDNGIIANNISRFISIDTAIIDDTFMRFFEDAALNTKANI